MARENTELIRLQLPDADIRYCQGFLTPGHANILFRKLRQDVAWQQDTIVLFGKKYLQPRLTALFGDTGKTYRYSGITMKPKPFPAILQEVRQKAEMMAGTSFNSCLLNLYRNGQDSNGWHSDDEKELGANPPIASVSLGQVRDFHLRHKKDKGLKHKLALANGSLLLMMGQTQHCWQHQIPKSTVNQGERINLTFRKLI